MRVEHYVQECRSARNPGRQSDKQTFVAALIRLFKFYLNYMNI